MRIVLNCIKLKSITAIQFSLQNGMLNSSVLPYCDGAWLAMSFYMPALCLLHYFVWAVYLVCCFGIMPVCYFLIHTRQHGVCMTKGYHSVTKNHLFLRWQRVVQGKGGMLQNLFRWRTQLEWSLQAPPVGEMTARRSQHTEHRSLVWHYQHTVCIQI
jgi:hypothetical protein